MNDFCAECFPAPDVIAALAANAQATRAVLPHVGDGSPDTVLACAHGSWRLGDVTNPAPAACSETTKAGEPCKGTPGPDGLCAAHKTAGA